MIRKASDVLVGPMEGLELKDQLSSIREEFDDHLNAINDNTLEIQDNHERIAQLDSKIDALASKLENTYMMVNELMKRRSKFNKISLSDEEQKLFIAIYSEDSKVSFTALSRKLGLKRSTIRLCLESMKKKEVPLFVEKNGAETFTMLEAKFKELQTRENLIKIDEKNRKNVFVRDLRYFF